MNALRRTAPAAIALAIGVVVSAPGAGAHPHIVSTNTHDQVLANGQNHPGFQPIGSDGLRQSCEGVLEPANSGPAGYGLETAHHGPDAGEPGKGDGCYAAVGNPADSNPAID